MSHHQLFDITRPTKTSLADGEEEEFIMRAPLRTIKTVLRLETQEVIQIGAAWRKGHQRVMLHLSTSRSTIWGKLIYIRPATSPLPTSISDPLTKDDGVI